ncbi:TonB-dependent receptor [uncultured Chitinophaga sp.]|uniref:TonB-dependent receptor domain-containing protein n=1 Tax=uncultured Chitinophaga sp. TaxID=339340 RepID=UPI00262D8210|nr:TonB-dependent receptor [uncultured Chitinophaga sp.]
MYSQEENGTGKITGVVRDSKGAPVQFATVVLLKQADSALVKGVMTDAQGAFQFEDLREGVYFVKISQLGFKTETTAPISVNGGSSGVSLPPVTLLTDAKNLKEVTVTGRKRLIELNADKLIFNVANTINTAGDNALQTLRKAPGVSVSQDDRISLNGAGGVQVMINGKQSYLSNKDLADVLRSMPASNIEAIEIISNPSARFDAAGTAGIINIRMKKDRSMGLNGSATINGVYGFTPKYDGSADVNYRRKKMNLYGSYSYYTGRVEEKYTYDRTQLNQDNVLTHYNQASTDLDDSKRHNFKAGADFFLNSRHTLGFLMNGSVSRKEENISSRTLIFTNVQTIDSVLQARNEQLLKRDNFNYNVNYRYQDSTGKQLNIDMDYVFFNRNDQSYQPNVYLNGKETTPLSSSTYRTIAPSDIKVYAAKADYEQPLFKGRLGGGAKFSTVRTANDFRFFNVIGGIDMTDSNRTNNFAYKEDIYAFYLNYDIKLKKWGIQAGLRYEQTRSHGTLTALIPVNDENIQRSYHNFFPSAAITYQPADAHTFSATYSRRIGRPSYQDLNPFEMRLDELTFSRGNAFLRPQYTHSMQLTYAFRQYLIVSAGYQHTTDVFAPIIDTTEGNKIIYMQRNVAKNNTLNLNISSALDIFDWWSCYLNASLYRTVFKGPVDLGNLNTDALTFSFNGQNSFKLTDRTFAEISLFYRSPEVYGTFHNSSIGEVDLGLQQDLWAKRATLKVSYTDIFYTLKLKSTSDFNGLDLYSSTIPESRLFKVSFTYRFGSNQIKAARNRSTGAADERRRI